MNKQKFIDAIRTQVLDGSIESVRSNLIKPPGRNPSHKLIDMAEWFNKLNDDERSMTLKIIKETAETTIFGFLCVLDGVRPIEDGEIKGKLNLYYEKEGSQTLLNDAEEEYLHDVFN